MLTEIADPEQVAVLRAAIAFMDAHQVEWNGRYFAAAAPGFGHTAVLVAHGPQFALLREGEGEALRLVAAHPEQLPKDAKLGRELRFGGKDRGFGLEM